ncbi:hypothetical protein M5K25_022106 [Dendrobium thyrsiflorum]|uniref:DUF8040 domain-containing protein n=1 Tax=Dendrobium thyrsiflorum TaxID=117978 RepID=A0ABD0U5P1_DENTH
MISSFGGGKLIAELLSGHPDRFYNMFHMSRSSFMDLLHVLEIFHGFRYFCIGLESIVSLSSEVIKSKDPMFRNTKREIQYDSRYMPYFKICMLKH